MKYCQRRSSKQMWQIYVCGSTDGHIYQTIVSKTLIYVKKKRKGEKNETEKRCGLFGADKFTSIWKRPVTSQFRGPGGQAIMHISIEKNIQK